jgi:diguanylate cyclase (GGDEF)-like protein/PAS domain S-box-containing protein
VNSGRRAARSDVFLGELAVLQGAELSTVLGSHVDQLFQSDGQRRSLIIRTEHNGHFGLLPRQLFYQAMAGPFGFGRSLFMGKPLNELLSQYPQVWDSLILGAERSAVAAGIDILGSEVEYSDGDDLIVDFGDGRLGTVPVSTLFRLVAQSHEDQLREIAASEARMRMLLQHGEDFIAILSPDGAATLMSHRIEAILGLGPTSITRTGELFDFVHPEDRPLMVSATERASVEPGKPVTVTARYRDASGGWRHIAHIFTDLIDVAEVGGLVVNARDVSESIRLNDELRHQALHDALTGLANRGLFNDRVDHALAARGRLGGVAVMFIDLDDFKTVNDSLGHEHGDGVLVEIATRLRLGLRQGETVARFGGDEFAVLVEDLTGIDRAEELARRLVDELSQPIWLGEHEVVVGASIGIAFSPERDDSAELLMRNADSAMYSAKREGKGRVVVFRAEMHARAADELRIRAELRRALQAEEFRVAFQPIVSLDTGDTLGFEALLRWQHPERGLLSPADFLGVAERSGLIAEIGRWVMIEACRTTVDLQRQLGLNVYVSVNLSVRQLNEESVAAVVAEALSQSGLSPRYLTLEITESLLMKDARLARTRLEALKRLGVQIAIDDFGTGYSSLSYLRDFSFDTLKIDRSFVEGIASGEGRALLQAIVQLAAALGVRSVAEGVETNDQADALRALGCRFAQGYLFSRPKLVEDLDLEALIGR